MNHNANIGHAVPVEGHDSQNHWSTGFFFFLSTSHSFGSVFFPHGQQTLYQLNEPSGMNPGVICMASSVICGAGLPCSAQPMANPLQLAWRLFPIYTVPMIR